MRIVMPDVFAANEAASPTRDTVDSPAGLPAGTDADAAVAEAEAAWAAFGDMPVSFKDLEGGPCR
jgi:hypothetical protein